MVQGRLAEIATDDYENQIAAGVVLPEVRPVNSANRGLSFRMLKQFMSI